MSGSPQQINEVRAVLQQFQDGYTKRDPETVDAFMALFVQDEELEVIGTGAARVGTDEWCIGPAKMRELVESDWRYWGDLRLEVETAHIHTRGEVAWLAAPGTISMRFGDEEYQNYLEYMQKIIKKPEWPAKEKVLHILRGSASTLYELYRGEQFVWPFRFSAVLVQEEGRWLFHQMQFSFPTTAFPDERIVAPRVSSAHQA